jgi:hypothetical protein
LDDGEDPREKFVKLQNAVIVLVCGFGTDVGGGSWVFLRGAIVMCLLFGSSFLSAGGRGRKEREESEEDDVVSEREADENVKRGADGMGTE